MATFADDTTIMAVGDSVEEATEKLQRTVDKINNWTTKWLIKLNEAKSVHVDFTNKRCQHIPTTINGDVIPSPKHSKIPCHDAGFQAALEGARQEKTRRALTEIQIKKMYWLMGRRSALSILNKLMLYKQILKPVWTYGIQLWGCTKQSNIAIIQRFQNKVLRNILDATWYIRNADIHRDLQMETVMNEIGKTAKKHKERLLHHVKVEVIQLLDNRELVRRFKRRKPF